MDLEGVSRDELLQTAAELQHLQTAALQGYSFAGRQPPASVFQLGPQQALPPPVQEVPTQVVGAMQRAPTVTQSEQQPQKYTRHEDQLNSIAQSTSWIMFQGQEWRRMQEESPEAIKMPAGKKRFVETDNFRYKRWNPTLRALEDKDSKAPLTVQEVVGLLEEAIVLSTKEGVLINYHATRQLLPEMTGPAVTWWWDSAIPGPTECGRF
ncbi:unnamed protein product [Symbiodinium necroappetens]|uniref:Uncharacterized protein n=1 Tax=Symbiodinium necroappetens TaxID=1628268 RepID=A0A813BPU3_9DINO|nr:unnamed protein product [Symbiodinium necroappetens]